MKLLNNTVAASSVVATRRILAQAQAHGIPTEALLEVLRASSGATWFSDNFTAIDWAKEGWDQNNTLGILHKDLSAAMHGRSDTECELEQALRNALYSIDALIEPGS